MISKAVRLGIKLAFKPKTFNISEFSAMTKGIHFPNKVAFNINKSATNFDCVVLDSKMGKKYIFSLKNKEGKLVQRFETGFDQNYVKKSSDYLTQAQYSDGSVLNFNSRNSFIGDVPKHHRTQTSFWDKRGALESYRETDVVLYRSKNDNSNGIKTIYEKTMPDNFSSYNSTDINETTTIIGLLNNKDLFYQRRSTFDTRTGKIYNWKSVSEGIDRNISQWLDKDNWVHTRFQSNPKYIAESVFSQKGLLGKVNITLSSSLKPNSGSYYLSKGEHNIEISNQSNPLQVFITTIHETTHADQDKMLIEYLSSLLKNKTEQEVIDYANSNTDEIAYLFKKYLEGHYGESDKIRKIAFDKPCNTFKEEEMRKLINANRNYVGPQENYSSYRENPLEVEAFAKEKKAQNERKFFVIDYSNAFKVENPESGYTVFA